MSHVSEYMWTFFWIAVLFLVFVVSPYRAWIKRRRIRRKLKALLGPGYSEDKSYISSYIAISVDEGPRQFAVADPKRGVLCSAEEILQVDLATEEFLQSLAVTTRNSDLPHLTIKSAFKSTRLREIFGRLKALQSDLDEGAETSVPTDDASKGTAGLEGAIRQLADAVSSLTEETKRLAARAERRSR